MFLHGWVGSSFCFSNQIDYFSKAYRVFVFEHKGHGKSDRPEDASYTVPEFAEELNQTLDKLLGDEKCVLIGHSMGGMISLTYATNPNFKKRLKGLILMSTTPKFENPGVQEYINLIKAGELSLKPNPEDLNSILVPLCFNQKYIQTHEETIKKFVEEKMDNSEYVAYKTLIAFVGSASMPATKEAAAAFEKETGIHVELHFGGSGSMLSQMVLSRRGDLYFP